MADKIVVMHNGLVEQIGAPLELYDRPANQFVAGFIGSPAMNFLKGTLNLIDGVPNLTLADGARVPLVKAPPSSDGRPLILGVRPENLLVAAAGLEAEVGVVEPMGSETQIAVKAGGHALICLIRDRLMPKAGDRLRLLPEPAHVHFFEADSGRRIEAL